MSSVVQPSSLADHSHSLSSLYLPPAAVASLPTGLLHLDGFDSLNAVSIKEGTVKKVPSKSRLCRKVQPAKFYIENGLVQWKNQPIGAIMSV